MKKITKILICLLMCLLLTGCFSKVYTRTSENDLDVCNNCNEVNDIDTLVDNIQIMNEKVNAINGTYLLTNTKDTYKISFDIITKDKRLNWDLKAETTLDDKEIKLFLKDGKFYVVYPYNGANIILKDTMENLVIELEVALKELNASYKEDNLENLVLGDKFAGFDFEKMKENASYIKNQDGSYTITLVDDSLTWIYEISSNYLITTTKCNADNFESVLTFSYPKNNSITYPNGLDFFTVNIENVKKILEIDNFAQLIDPSLKD